VSGSMAYVADGLPGLQVIDVSNPASPVIVRGVDTPGVARGVVVSGSMVFVADGTGGLQVIDVSNPASPGIVGSAAVPGEAWGVAVSGPVAYVAGSTGGLQVIDVSNPASPVLVGSMDTPGLAWGVVVSGSAVYVADACSGLEILPGQCDVTPVLLSRFTAVPQPEGILLEWATASESDFSGFHVHRSTRPEAEYLRLTPGIMPPSASYRFLDGDVLPGITYYYRLEALGRTGDREFFGPVAARMDPPSNAGLGPELGWSRPNPFGGAAGTTVIPFALAREGGVTLRVFDLSGRQVRVLVAEAMGKGEHTVSWDGRNDRGEIAPAGVYLYELEAPGFRATRRLVRIR